MMSTKEATNDSEETSHTHHDRLQQRAGQPQLTNAQKFLLAPPHSYRDRKAPRRHKEKAHCQANAIPIKTFHRNVYNIMYAKGLTCGHRVDA